MKTHSTLIKNGHSRVKDLTVNIQGKTILKNLNLSLKQGESHIALSTIFYIN
jgi:ABC-type molybdenum transport system ATPase subunit/photorepair protein PhrA